MTKTHKSVAFGLFAFEARKRITSLRNFLNMGALIFLKQRSGPKLTVMTPEHTVSTGFLVL